MANLCMGYWSLDISEHYTFFCVETSLKVLHKDISYKEALADFMSPGCN